MPIGIILSVIMLGVIMLSVIMPSFIMLSVVALKNKSVRPWHFFQASLIYTCTKRTPH
jgi:hypothetical protein